MFLECLLCHILSQASEILCLAFSYGKLQLADRHGCRLGFGPAIVITAVVVVVGVVVVAIPLAFIAFVAVAIAPIGLSTALIRHLVDDGLRFQCEACTDYFTVCLGFRAFVCNLRIAKYALICLIVAHCKIVSFAEL